ncbi:TPA: hypothetical protein ACOEHP_004497, partial [Enterobacter ludwigii]
IYYQKINAEPSYTHLSNASFNLSYFRGQYTQRVAKVSGYGDYVYGQFLPKPQSTARTEAPFKSTSHTCALFP